MFSYHQSLVDELHDALHCSVGQLSVARQLDEVPMWTYMTEEDMKEMFDNFAPYGRVRLYTDTHTARNVPPYIIGTYKGTLMLWPHNFLPEQEPYRSKVIVWNNTLPLYILR